MNPLLDLSARLVIAHRGSPAQAPENTLPGFELAVRQGADAIELDVQLTRDGVPVVLHDPDLDRTTDKSGPLGRLTLDQLQREVDAGARFTPDGGRSYPFRGRGVRVPTLAQVCEQFREVPLMVEIKEVAAQEPVRQVLLRQGNIERFLVASEHHAALEIFRGSAFAVAASSDEIGSLYRRALLGWLPAGVSYRALSVPQRYRRLPVATRRFIAAARRLGCPVHVWTINNPAAARRLWASGAAGMVTDFPDRIRAIQD